jgi:hypothetical protein
MRLLMPIGAAVVALAVTASAQDTTVRSRTRVKADDAKVMTMTGCLHQDPASGAFSLAGTMAAAGDELTTRTKVTTDVDRDEVEVRGRSRTEVEDGAIATSGTASTFALVPGSGVNLASHVGHQVQVSAIVVERGEGDAEVTVRDKTTVDPDNGRDTTSRTKTKIEVPKSPRGSYSVVSVKALGGNCAAH